MKKVLLFSFFFFNVHPILLAQKSHDSSRIEIKYVDPNIETIIAVSCEKFGSAFNESIYKDYTVSDSFIISKLKDAYQTITYYKEPRDIDVRYKLSIHFAGDKKAPLIICVDKFNESIINGQSVKKEKFFSLLKKVIAMIPKEFPVK